MKVGTTELVVALGALAVMVLYWIYYIFQVRKTPKSEAWYDASDIHGPNHDGALYMFPYGTLVMGAAGTATLVEGLTLPEPVRAALRTAIVIAFLIGVIGFTGTFGIPLPWPFVPRSVVRIRKAKRARARLRRAEKKTNKKKPKGTE